MSRLRRRPAAETQTFNPVSPARDMQGLPAIPAWDQLGLAKQPLDVPVFYFQTVHFGASGEPVVVEALVRAGE